MAICTLRWAKSGNLIATLDRDVSQMCACYEDESYKKNSHGHVFCLGLNFLISCSFCYSSNTMASVVLWSVTSMLLLDQPLNADTILI